MSEPTVSEAIPAQELSKPESWTNYSRLLGGLVVLCFTLIFILPWWNRYVGITNEGWYQFFGMQILKGRVPYRDFYLFVPPGQALVMAGLTAVFGERLIVPEVFGLAAALAIALVLYVWLSRLFPAIWATLATVSSIAIYFRSPNESLSGLQVDSNLYPVLALAAASYGLDRDAGYGSAVLAGFFAGASFVTKQTAGVALLTLGGVLPVLVAVRSRFRAGLRTWALFTVGWAVPVVSTCAWLAKNGAFRDFLNDVFLQGPSSKGSLSSLLARQIFGVFANRYQEVAAVLSLLAVVSAGLLLHFMKESDGENAIWSRRRELFAVAGFGAAAILLTIYAQHSPNSWPARMHRLDFFSSAVPIYIGEFGSVALLLIYGLRLLRRKLTAREEQILLAASTCFFCAFLFSFSWATGRMGRIMLIPAFPFVAAFGLSRLPHRRVTSYAKYAVAVLALLCIAVMAGTKARIPYYWADWQEGDATRANVALDFPELSGIRVTPETAAFMNRLIADIRQYSRPGDTIAEFPTMPVLYMLAHRSPATFAFIHYIDVTPDYIYRRDIDKLKSDPPAVIVLLGRSEAELREDEINFRNGRRSAERDLWETLHSLNCNYQVGDVLETPGTKQRFEVWVRRSTPAEMPCAASTQSQ